MSDLELLTSAVRCALRGSGEVPWPALAADEIEQFVAAAERHRVAVLLDRAARTIAAPPELRARIHAVARQQTERALLLVRQLRAVTDALAQHGIESLPVKGPVLAATAYGDAALRGASGDLDFVVQPAQLDRAVEALAALGYVRVEEAIDEHDHEKWGSEAHLLPQTAAEGTMVELHTDLIGNFYTAPVDLDSLLARSSKQMLFGREVRVIAPDDLLLYLCMHGARHMWSRLLWVADVARLIETNAIDWPALIARADAIDARQRLALGVYLAARLFGTTVPEGAKALVRARLLPLRARVVASQMRDTMTGRAMGLLGRATMELAARETAGQIATYVRRQLEPNARDRAAMPLPKSLAWLRWILRPLRVVTSYGQRTRAGRA